MASLSGNPDSLVVLRFHNFRTERMRHWWTLLGRDDHASIMAVFGKFSSLMRLRVNHGLLEALPSFWGPTHCCFSIGKMDLVPTLEEYAELFQLDSPFSETPIIPTQGPRSNRVLEKYLGLTSVVLRPEISHVDETWLKASISLDLLTKYFSWRDFPTELAGDFIAGKIDLGVIPLIFSEGRSIIPAILCKTVWSLSYCRRQREGVPMFCTQLLQLWLCSHLRYFYLLQTPYHFERHTVRQTVDTVLFFTGNTNDWVLYLLDLPLSEWSWRVTWGPAVWRPWTHYSLFDGVPLPGVWGCTGYYPGLALLQFGGIQYLPRLGDLSSVTFDYVPGNDMWRFLTRVEDIWRGRCSEMVLVEDSLLADSSVTADFAEWREGWSPSFTLRPTIQPSVSHSSVSPSLRASAATGQSERVAVFERELEEARVELASLRLARASEREESAARVESMQSTLHHSNAVMANLRRRPYDIVALRRALDESEAALTAAHTSMEAIQVQISVLQGDNAVLLTEVDLVQDALESDAYWLNNREGLPVVRALHQATQVVDSLGARARAILEEHDEGDPALSTALGRFCMETCIRLGH
uniref:DUF7745 domain-containing protein n=1 Tax=Fagus sylvatica TaxID=28930 RepID=A0A2N9EYM4_FAGSY